LLVQLPAQLSAARLEITDALGRLVLQTPVRNGQRIDVSQLVPGLYQSRVAAGTAIGVSRFSKE
jgi:hypothetical protein